MQLSRNPTLQSVLMVEEAVEKSDEGRPYVIWKSLPRKMSYQAFRTIVEYLKESGKIAIDAEGKLVWIWDPEGVRRYLSRQGLALSLRKRS